MGPRPKRSDFIYIDDALSDRAKRFAATVAPARGNVIVPRAVRVRDGALEWSAQAPGWDGTWSEAQYAEAGTTHYTRGRIDDQVLKRFIKLFREPDAKVVEFARRYGVLYVQPNGVPNGEPDEVEYPDETYQTVAFVRDRNGKVVGLGRRGVGDLLHIERANSPVLWHREPLQLWRDWSLLVRLLLLYGLALRDTANRIEPEALLRQWQIDLPPADDVCERWYMSEPISLVYALTFTRVGPARDNQTRLTTASEQRENLGGWLDSLAGHAGTVMRLDWAREGRLQARIGRSYSENLSWLTNTPNRVFGDVMVQLVNALVGDGQQRICPDCGEPFERKGKETRCEDCRLARKQATQRAKWNKYRARYNQERRARANGTIAR
ncbi:MAG TPA: hypothetical protein VGR16_14830 [Thermomicrobiales bacterium]|nr:hypothetical protein [Thermomicrobiales bacterium]